jgi:hypothetical protein
MEAVYLPETYVRHQGPTTATRVFAGPPEQQDGLDPMCLVCDQPIVKGQPCTLVPIGCQKMDDQEKMRKGHWVSARAIVVHASCAGRSPEAT